MRNEKLLLRAELYYSIKVSFLNLEPKTQIVLCEYKKICFSTVFPTRQS